MTVDNLSGSVYLGSSITIEIPFGPYHLYVFRTSYGLECEMLGEYLIYNNESHKFVSQFYNPSEKINNVTISDN